MAHARFAQMLSSRRTPLHRTSSVRFPSQRCFVGVLTFRGRDSAHEEAQDPRRPAGQAHRQEVHRAPGRDAPRIRPPRVLPEDGLARAKLLPGVRVRTANDEVVHLQGECHLWAFILPTFSGQVLTQYCHITLFQCIVGGMEFQPTIAVDEKKDAKANAAWKVFHELGFLKPDPSNPL